MPCTTAAHDMASVVHSVITVTTDGTQCIRA